MSTRGRIPHRRVLVLTVAAMGVLGGGACATKAPMPKTYRVTGKVMYKEGQVMEGGLIELLPVSSSPLTTNGDIQPDGTFSLRTRGDNRTISGAQEGRYRVTIIPKRDADWAALPALEPIVVQQTYTVKPADSNDFTITIAIPRRKP